ncbi:DNA gyrase inhibitor YacG [Acuticoccus sp. I52.16.1]|uniref:DNA gyrase inhibitor YacG n=1 Tax=Acuticoccus sp. I52.16.1 TaxID=2928472 RepID=UPI001FD3B8FA|nr:DNA gyrase inhibitor YacG [Acuticoccus sp. I52.16.1]UOM32902.1 DNA gyrase inhibitor YacG [Acuticoccus sp. I52.16.1]
MNAHDPAVPPPARPCPVCGKESQRETRPFCSKRCADVDLHRWLGGQYRVPVIEEDGGQDETPRDE